MMPLLTNGGGLLLGLLLLVLVILAVTYRPPRHRPMDPLCRLHLPPRTLWARWLYDKYEQGRGRPCPACSRYRRYVEWGVSW